MTTIIYQINPQQVEREADRLAGLELEKYSGQEIAFAGLEIISRRLEARTYHYRNVNGDLLTTLDEVARAVEDGELRCPTRVEWLAAQ